MTATPTELESAREDALGAVRARLRTFLARRVESPEVADDLTQEVLLRLLQHRDSVTEHLPQGCTGSPATCSSTTTAAAGS